MRRPLEPVAVFLLFLLFLSGLAAALLLSTKAPGATLFLMAFEWTPGLSALLTFAMLRGSRASFEWRWLPLRETIASYAFPLLYTAPVYMLTWILARGSFQPAAFVTSSAKAAGFPMWPKLATLGIFVPMSLTVGLLSRFPYTLGEELGWRGLLLPQLLRRFGFSTSCLITGVIWALWHYPLLYAFGMFSGPRAATRMLHFTVMVVGLSFVFGWVRLRCKSLWPCVLMHASHNAFLQTVFDPLTVSPARTASVTSEFGWGLMLTVGTVAGYLAFTRRRADGGVPSSPSHLA